MLRKQNEEALRSYPSAVSFGFRVNNLVCLTMAAVPLCCCPYSHPYPASTRNPLPSPPPPRFLLSLFTFAMLAKCFAGLHGSQIRPSKSDNAGSGSTLACQLIPIVNCFKQIKGNRTWPQAQSENEAKGEVGSGLHGELFISSTFTYSDPHPSTPQPVLRPWTRLVPALAAELTSLRVPLM